MTTASRPRPAAAVERAGAGAGVPSVAVPLAGFNFSGGVKVLVTLVNAMAARAWPVRVIVPDFASASPFPLAPGVEVAILRTGPATLPKTVRQIGYYARLACVAGRGVDICLANYFPTALCATASRGRMRDRGRVVYYVQGYEAMSHGLIAEANALSRLVRFAGAKLSYRVRADVVCVSHWVCGRVGRKDARVAHAPALDLDVYRPRRAALRAPDRPVVIGTIGRSGTNKGYAVFLRALERMGARSDVLVLVASPTAGEVPLPAGVRAEAVVARTEAEMAAFYNRCDIFVLASYVEGFPLPPLEAMACGCAVVTTACGGVVDYAEHDVNALVVPPGAPDALARAMRSLCDDADRRDRLVASAAATVRRFEKTALLERFLDSMEETWNRSKR